MVVNSLCSVGEHDSGHSMLCAYLLVSSVSLPSRYRCVSASAAAVFAVAVPRERLNGLARPHAARRASIPTTGSELSLW